MKKAFVSFGPQKKLAFPAIEGGKVEGLVKGALIDGSVTQVAKAASFETFVFQGEGKAGAEGGLAADDSVAAPVIFVRRKKVHRAALAA